MPRTTTSRRTTRLVAFPFEWDVETPDRPVPPIQWDANLYMAPQAYSWNCSACALDWVLRATWLAPETHTPNDALYEIGYPQNVNANYGLMDGTGRQLQRVLSDYGQQSEQSYLDFDTVYQLATGTTGLMSGREWYHWVALRGTSFDDLWIANSAPGYRGVRDILSRRDFERLGSFNIVWLVEG